MSQKNNPKIPRTLEEITKLYNQAAGVMANAEYVARVNRDEVRRAYKEMLSLNVEAAERKELDEQKAAEEKKKEGTNE
jgi:hypothetical protein